MKIFVTLCLLQPALAFVAEGPAIAAKTALYSSPEAREFQQQQRVTGRPNVDRSAGGPLRRRDPYSNSPSKEEKGIDRGGRGYRESYPPTLVQGGSLETWSFPDPRVDRVQVILETDGRPLNANVELWQGPDNSPQKMGVYLEDGSVRPFNVIIPTPRGSNAVAVRNTGNLEFPIIAGVQPESSGGLWDFDYRTPDGGYGRTIQGGAVYTTPFPPGVESVQILMRTDGRPLNARIELLQGPNNNKEVIELYSEDGADRPFLCVMETPGVGNVIRIVNTATVEFPLYTIIEPLQVTPGYEMEAEAMIARGRARPGGRSW